MIRGQQKFIEKSSNPLIAAIGIKFLETSNENVQAVAKANNRTYKEISRICQSCLMDWSKLARIIVKKLNVLGELETGMNINQSHIETIEELTDLIDLFTGWANN